MPMTIPKDSQAERGPVSAVALSLCFPVIVVALLLVTQGVLLNANAQAPPPHNAAKPEAKKKFQLRITKEGVIGVSLKADKVKLSDVAAELSKQLGTKVILGPALAKETITVEFSELTLEPALRLLAPRVYVDYEMRADAQPVPMGIFLLDSADPEPEKTAVVQATTQAMMIEGNTEDTEEKTGADQNEPLQVELEDNNLTIKSNKQPLIAVVMEVADLLGVPVGINYDSNEIVDLEIKKTPLEDAILQLSPNIRLYVRADLTKPQRVPLRLAIVPPPARTEGQ
jgi:type II secretory pathway component GspD/PulD (secretin)